MFSNVVKIIPFDSCIKITKIMWKNQCSVICYGFLKEILGIIEAPI